MPSGCMGRSTCRRNRIGLNGRNNAALPERGDRRDAPWPSPALRERNTSERRQSPTACATPARRLLFPPASTMMARAEERPSVSIAFPMRWTRVRSDTTCAPGPRRRHSTTSYRRDELLFPGLTTGPIPMALTKGSMLGELHHHEHQGEAPSLRRIGAVILLDVAAHLGELRLSRVAPARALRLYRRELPPATMSAPPVGRAGSRAACFRWRPAPARTAAGAG